MGLIHFLTTSYNTTKFTIRLKTINCNYTKLSYSKYFSEQKVFNKL